MMFSSVNGFLACPCRCVSCTTVRGRLYTATKSTAQTFDSRL